MKKVRIDVNTGSLGRAFNVFSTPEALYCWLVDAPGVDVSEQCQQVVITPDEFIEAEWMGCEFVYDGPYHHRLDNVRLVKARESANGPGYVIDPFYGWVLHVDVPFRDASFDDIVTKLIDESTSCIDLREVFADDECSEIE